MQPRDVPTYEVTLSLSVDDPSALWAAAAQYAMLVGGMALNEVVDTLGSANDAQLDDCLMMLVDPTRFGGCTVTALTCDNRHPCRSTGAVEQHVATILPAAAPMRANGITRATGMLRERFG